MALLVMVSPLAVAPEVNVEVEAETQGSGTDEVELNEVESRLRQVWV